MTKLSNRPPFLEADCDTHARTHAPPTMNNRYPHSLLSYTQRLTSSCETRHDRPQQRVTSRCTAQHVCNHLTDQPTVSFGTSLRQKGKYPLCNSSASLASHRPSQYRRDISTMPCQVPATCARSTRPSVSFARSRGRRGAAPDQCCLRLLNYTQLATEQRRPHPLLVAWATRIVPGPPEPARDKCTSSPLDTRLSITTEVAHNPF